jgi:hypothetical protein
MIGSLFDDVLQALRERRSRRGGVTSLSAFAWGSEGTARRRPTEAEIVCQES